MIRRQELTYLVLERIALEADADGDQFGLYVREHMMPFWDALSDAEQERLNTVPGRTMDSINPTIITVDDADRVSVAVTIQGDALRAALRGAVFAVERSSSVAKGSVFERRRLGAALQGNGPVADADADMPLARAI